MRLLELNLSNFRQHVNTELSFSAGLTAIVGLNGAGKTTLIEAIAFALFGSRALRGKLEDVRTRGLPKEATTQVDLTFEQEGRNFKISRALNDAELFSSGEAQPICRGSREVSARVSALLGMGYEEFVAAFYTEQKGLEFLSAKKGAAERERFVVRMLGYDKLEEVQELLRVDRRDLRNQISGAEASQGDKEKLAQAIEQESATLEIARSRLSEAEQTLKKAEADLESGKKQLAVIDHKRAEFIRLEEELRSEQIRYEEKISAIRKLEQERKQLIEKHPELRDDNQNSTLPDISTVRIEIGLQEKSVAELVKALQFEQNAHSELLSAKRATVNALKTQLTKLQTRRKQVATLGKDQACPTCGQELGASLKGTLKHLDLELKSSEQELEVAEKELSAVHPESAAMVRLKSEISHSQQQLAERKAIMDLVLGSQEQALALKRIDLDLKIARQYLEPQDLKLKELKQRIKSSGFDQQHYLKVKGAHDAAFTLTNVARMQRVRAEAELDKSVALLDRSKRQLEELETRLAEINSAKTKLRLFEEGDEILTNFRKYLNTALRPRLAELASDFLNDLSDGRYSNVEVAEDFSPSIVDLSGPRSVISGGEEDILNLCMRLALSQLLLERSGQGVSLLVLDEIFGALDEGRRNNVLMLLEKLSSRFEQVIVITHFDDLKDAVHNLIYLNYDEDLGSVVLGQPLPEQEEQAFNF